MSPNPGDAEINERSPLISPVDPNEELESGRLSDVSEEQFNLDDSIVESKNTWYLLLLTVSIGGLQIVWSIELSNGSPFLLSLGMSKALMSFVWLAGPMTGVLVQPYIGIISDRCRISWGRRKPFMLAGMAGTVISSFLLAYSKLIVRTLGGWGGDAKYEGYFQGITIAFATVMMWVLDFSINTVQAAIRAFMVDGAPAHQQEETNAWGSRWIGIGNVLGYVFGYMDLPAKFPHLGKEQFQVLCAIASIALSSTVLLSILTIKEKNPQDDPSSQNNRKSLGLISFFKEVFASIKRLSPPIRSVCEIQFCHWIGWFPFLFYSTTYVGQLYVNPDLHPGMTDDEVDQVWAKATRVGTFALLIYAIVSFAANILIPFIIEPTYKASAVDPSGEAIRSISPDAPVGATPRSASYGEIAQSEAEYETRSSLVTGNTKTSSSIHSILNGTTRSYMSRMLQRLQIPGLTLRWAWFYSQILFTVCMFSTFFISTPRAATAMIAVMGISWSLSLWAPFALISAEISKQDQERARRQRQKLLSRDPEHPPDYDDQEEDRAGIILGLHNVAVSAPQVLATLLSSVIFKLLQKPRNVPGDTSVAWTMRVGGLAGLGAAFLTYRMRESVKT